METSLKSVDTSTDQINLADLIKKGEAIFEDAGKFHLWFQLRNAALGNEIPAELAKTVHGQQAVLEELSRIEYAEFN